MCVLMGRRVAHLQHGQRGVQLRQGAEIVAVAVRLRLEVHGHAGPAHELQRVRRRHAAQQVRRRVLVVQHLRGMPAHILAVTPRRRRELHLVAGHSTLLTGYLDMY